ncbi:ester cyclase [Bradyrhizobium sp. 24]|uniref:ester cyclase n=1 Tax=unclassified Bradyrhizobium TaxID=2631580 RepID=UPI001FF8E643|nr:MULTISPECIES: ester cyclase [unclassified Bradyrhizobium]MCK1298429.1 ester cyclase [Bradyrhizobium sp. 37]MCK1378216.1 ester cyclase [Bradyrhizobium sp. 24]MCK1769472.1 ester cyclase [Bradyrhizobium sp. 134]
MIAPPPGLEPAMDFGKAVLSPQKEVVRKFYKDMWDHADIALIPEIFQPGFTFKGSLGPVLVGYDQFADYVRWVTDSLESYTSDILALVEEGNRISGKLRFHGIHRRPIFGHAPTGRHVWWFGAPIFTFHDGRVADLWVLGDIHGLIAQLAPDAASKPEFATKA